MADTIKITKTCAIWLINYCKQIVDDGYGTNYNPHNPIQALEPYAAGFIDQIPMEDGELWRYMNAAINLARTLAGILAKAIADDIDGISDLTIEDGEI
ncbi:MAG: hypothetical protein [Cressdnaviricota sp.]|nr:MAG: hypothetical protein [Cressdnaviricota sp.]